MKGYKRLTHKDDIYYVDVINDKHEIVCSPKSDNNLCVVLSAQKIVKLLNRLVELENAIESGELCDREELIEHLMTAKDTSTLTDKEIEFFIKHNEKVRKVVAKEIVSIIKRYNHKETMIGPIEKKYNIDIDLEDKE